MLYTPNDWYWRADDGSVYGSARLAYLAEPSTDPIYQAWLAAGHTPTRWPVDDAGEQTLDELARTLEPAGVLVRLADYVAAKRRDVISGGVVVTVAGVDVPTWADAASQGALTALVVAAGINPQITTAWKGRDGLFYELNASDITTLALGVMAFVQSAFTTETTVLAAIDAGTISTVAQVDAAAWPEN